MHIAVVSKICPRILTTLSIIHIRRHMTTLRIGRRATHAFRVIFVALSALSFNYLAWMPPQCGALAPSCSTLRCPANIIYHKLLKSRHTRIFTALYLSRIYYLTLYIVDTKNEQCSSQDAYAMTKQYCIFFSF